MSTTLQTRHVPKAHVDGVFNLANGERVRGTITAVHEDRVVNGKTVRMVAIKQEDGRVRTVSLRV